MTKVTRNKNTVNIEFDTEQQAIKCEEQTKYMFEHPNLVRMAGRIIKKK